MESLMKWRCMSCNMAERKSAASLAWDAHRKKQEAEARSSAIKAGMGKAKDARDTPVLVERIEKCVRRDPGKGWWRVDCADVGPSYSAAWGAVNKAGFVGLNPVYDEKYRMTAFVFNLYEEERQAIGNTD